jgi:hypothetical protein
MGGIQSGNFAMFAEKVDFSGYSTVADLGGAKGDLAVALARRHPHLTGVTLDLPPVQPVAAEQLPLRRYFAKLREGARIIGGLSDLKVFWR